MNAREPLTSVDHIVPPLSLSHHDDPRHVTGSQVHPPHINSGPQTLANVFKFPIELAVSRWWVVTKASLTYRGISAR